MFGIFWMLVRERVDDLRWALVRCRRIRILRNSLRKTRRNRSRDQGSRGTRGWAIGDAVYRVRILDLFGLEFDLSGRWVRGVDRRGVAGPIGGWVWEIAGDHCRWFHRISREFTALRQGGARKTRRMIHARGTHAEHRCKTWFLLRNQIWSGGRERCGMFRLIVGKTERGERGFSSIAFAWSSLNCGSDPAGFPGVLACWTRTRTSTCMSAGKSSRSNARRPGRNGGIAWRGASKSCWSTARRSCKAISIRFRISSADSPTQVTKLALPFAVVSIALNQIPFTLTHSITAINDYSSLSTRSIDQIGWLIDWLIRFDW